MKTGQRIRVGITEGHGMALEMMREPPVSVDYSLMEPTGPASPWISSPIKGFMRSFESKDHDLLEAVLSPIITGNRWVYSLASFSEAMAFRVGRLPTPRMIRWSILRRMFMKNNFRGFLFWSKWGELSLHAQVATGDRSILAKSHVVYPAVVSVPEEQLPDHPVVRNILFSGDFFRKGGVNVVDAFLRLHARNPDLRLIVCSDPQTEFNTGSTELRSRYMALVTQHPGIRFLGRIPRERMLAEILPDTQMYLIPTYAEAFGFAILEAMSYGIPVISTNICAIPEIIDDGSTGLLVDVSKFDIERRYRSYVVDSIADDFREYLTESLYSRMSSLVENPDLRRTIGAAARGATMTRFSFKTRNKQLEAIYQSALS